MDLKTFISDTLIQIVAGVSDAQRAVAQMGVNAAINPASVSSTSRRQLTGVRPVDFDVAVTVVDRAGASSSDDGRQSSGMISVVQSMTESQTRSSEEESSSKEAVSRIRFSVMLAQPGDVDVYQQPNLAELGKRMG